MVTKRQLAEQLRGLASRQSPGFSTPLPDLLLLVGQLRDELLLAEYYQVQATGEGRELLGELVNTFYDQPVRHDAQRKRDFVVLPARVLPLPGGRGVFGAFYDAAGGAGEAQPVVISPPGTAGLLAHHPAGALQGRLGAWVEAGRGGEAGRLWLRQPTSLLHPTLHLQLVVAAADAGDELPCPLPAHLQNRVLTAGLERLLRQPRQDRTADNVDQA